MGLSEYDVEKRLAGLRRKRETLDREIADLLLYLELGRRLGANDQQPVDGEPVLRQQPELNLAPRENLASEEGHVESEKTLKAMPRLDEARLNANSLQGRPTRSAATVGRPRAGQPAADVVRTSESDTPIPPAVAFADDPTAARRYGRAIIEAACLAISQAGQPLHARDILERLVSRGFTVPGRDPVAALNTRLWKQATPEGPLKRLGDASYAFIERQSIE